MTTKTIKTLLSVALLGMALSSMGCDERDWHRYYGGDYSVTDVAVGIGFWPTWGDYAVVDEYQVVTPYYTDTHVDTGSYYDGGYYDGGSYDNGYYDGGYYGGDYYADCPDCGYKTKLPGRSK